MNDNYFTMCIDAMKNNENYKLITFDRQSIIDEIDSLIRQLKITKECISGAPDSNYRTKRHAAEWLFSDSQWLDDIIKRLINGEYDND